MASQAARILTEADEAAAEAGAPAVEPTAATEPVQRLRPVGPGPIRQPSKASTEPPLVAVEVDDSGKPIGEPLPEPAAEPEAEPLEAGTEQEPAEPTAETGQQERTSPRATRRQAQKAARARSEQERDGLRRRVIAQEAELAALRNQFGAIEPRLNQLGEQQARDAVTRIDGEIRDLSAALRANETRMAEAMTAGDSAALTKAISDRDDLRDQKFRLDNAKAQLTAARSRQPAPGTRQPAPAQVAQPAQRPLAPAAQAYIRDFQDRHADWFNPQAGDTDSRVVYTLDQAVADDGFDPTTPDYWDELEDRMRTYLPHRFANGAATPANGRQPAARPAPAPQRRGPMVAPASERSPGMRPGAVAISPQRKQAMIDANILNADGTVADETRFQRVLKQYADYDGRAGAAR